MNKYHLPKHFLAKIPNDLKDKTRDGIAKYLQCDFNNEDKIVMVATQFIVNELMSIVAAMSIEELNLNDWWNNGFVKKPSTTSSPKDHNGIVEYATKLSKQLWNEYHATVRS